MSPLNGDREDECKSETHRLAENVEDTRESDDGVCDDMEADVVLWLKTSMAPFLRCDQAGGSFLEFKY